MPSVVVSMTVLVGLREAARVAGLDEQAFVERAIRLLAARHGVEIDEPPPSPVRPPPAVKPKSKGGRPRRPATWPTNHDIPAGYYPVICPNCGRSFRVDDLKIVSCSDQCQTMMENRVMYQRRKARRDTGDA